MIEFQDPLLRWASITEAVGWRLPKQNLIPVLAEMVAIAHRGIVPVGWQCSCKQSGLSDRVKKLTTNTGEPLPGDFLFHLFKHECLRIPGSTPLEFYNVLVGRHELRRWWRLDDAPGHDHLPTGPKALWRLPVERWLLRVATGKEPRHSLDMAHDDLADGAINYLLQVERLSAKKIPEHDTIRKWIDDEVRRLG
jgi:hypothetical protein